MNNTELAVAQGSAKKPNALMSLANRLSLSPEKLQETLRKTVFKGCRTDEEFAVLVAVSNEYELNPLTKQIYAFPAKGGGVEPIVSIDGWLKIINSQPNFDGMEVVISDDGEEATCKIYTKDRSHPTTITEYKSECYRKTDPWNTMPKRMLRHKAIMQCGRVAFGISGIYDEDEAKDIGGSKPAERNITPRTEPIDPFKSQPKIDQAEATQEVKTETPESAPVSEDAPTPIEVTIAAYKLLEGVSEKTGKAWRIHALTLNDGKNTVEAKTFSNTIGGIAEFNVGSKALVTLEKTPKGLGVLTLEVAETAVEGSLC